MEIIDRFSTHLRETLTRSVLLATELKNEAVEPMHMFFILANLKGSIATEIIALLKIDFDDMEKMLLEIPSIKKNNKKTNTTTQKKTAELSNMSSVARRAVEKAIMNAHNNKHNFVGTEHLLYALSEINDPLINKLLQISNIKKEDLKDHLNAVLSNASKFPQITEAAEIIEKMQDNIENGSSFVPPSMNSPMPPMPNISSSNTQGEKSALSFFATNLTSSDMQKDLDPVIGRDHEIERLIQIICRRTKNNPVLLGDPGVGKTAIVEGLAKKIYEGNVPDILLGKKIFALDMALLLAGTTFRGEFESRLQQIIEDICGDPNIIVFIDEVHNIVGAGSNQGTMDAANILKPVLARGQMRCIGATTTAEFKKYIENDAALERRFQPIYVKQSSVKDTAKILQGIKRNYEKYHNVKITDEACVAAAELSDRYIVDKFLPDKAIDLLDETAASLQLTAKKSPTQKKLIKLMQNKEQLILAKEKAASQDDFEEAVKLKQDEEKTSQEIDKLIKNEKKEKPSRIKTIKRADITRQLAKVLNTNIEELLLDESKKLNDLHLELKKSVIGQDLVIEDVAKIIRQARLQLSDPKRPAASFMFVGSSGVGKTELAQVLAETIYPNQDALIKLNMSEYNEAFGVSKLLGSPAGYVGYRESNQFTDKLKRNPYSVVLFDEIDKAHKDVSKLLLQILENGEINESTGKKVSLKHAIIILTTTHGAEEAMKNGIGFDDIVTKKEEIEKNLAESLKEYFSPEIINRLDRVSLFNNLDNNDLEKITQLEVARFNERLKKYKTKIQASSTTIKSLLNNIPSKQSSARDIRQLIRKELESLIAVQIINKETKPIYNIDMVDNNIIIK